MYQYICVNVFYSVHTFCSPPAIPQKTNTSVFVFCGRYAFRAAKMCRWCGTLLVSILAVQSLDRYVSNLCVFISFDLPQTSLRQSAKSRNSTQVQFIRNYLPITLPYT